ncbi:60 kDa chaperonin 2 [Bienertia sinuspersici]
MAAELQPPVLENNPITNPISGATQNVQLPSTEIPGPTLGPKRQRRPSVRWRNRDQPATLRTSRPWRLNPHPNPHRESNPNKPSKTRPLTNLVTPINGNFESKRPTTSANSKRVRTNFRIDQSQQHEQEHEQEQEQPSGDVEERENGFNNHDFNDFHDEDDDDGEEGSVRATRVSNSNHDLGWNPILGIREWDWMMGQEMVDGIRTCTICTSF